MKSVGKQLEAARLAKNWTPELAARETKIKVDRLRDLEADNYSNFTSPAYARGFVRTYARFLGLDEYAILRQLDNKLPDDDTPNLVTDSNVGYLPETSLPPRVAHRDYTGLYVLLTLGCVILLIFAFVLFEAYRIGELPRYFTSTSSQESAGTDTTTNTASTKSPADSSARALPVDGSTPPPPVVASDTAPTNAPSGGVRALPVDPSELATGTNAAAATAPAAPDTTVHAVRALPVDPSELTNAPAATPTPAPTVAATDTSTAPRALPVDLNNPEAAVNPPPPAPPAPVTPAPTAPVMISSSSARQSNSGPVVMPASPSATGFSPSAVAPPPPATTATTNIAPQVATGTDKPLVLTASQDSFVRVTSQDSPDGDKPLYASVLHSGQSIAFEGRKFSINVGVPSAVDIKLDGVNYGPHSDQETPETFTVESHQP